jgi:hypothetical protein
MDFSFLPKPSGRFHTWWLNAHFLSKYQTMLVTAILLIAVSLLTLSAPQSGDFWFSDAPRHAMDGIFWRDFFSDLPIFNAKQYAFDYYLKYPALTILLYPPGFAWTAAVVYAVFGISSLSAQLVVGIHYLAAAIGAFFLVRRWLGARSALAVSLLFIGIHEVALWGRQVMLEIPTYAFALWCAHFFLKYTDTKKPAYLYLSILLLTAGAYTKQTIVFLGAVFAVSLLHGFGWRIIRNKDVWIAFFMCVVLLAPLAFMGMAFGDVNIRNVISGFSEGMSRLSLKNWLYYFTALPRQLGWPILTAACLYPLISLIKRKWQLPPIVLGFFIAWICCGYIFFSLLAVKEPRHSLLILFPFTLFAILAVRGILKTKYGTLLAVAFSVFNLATVVAFDKVPYVAGYREAAQYVCQHAPRNSSILFAGQRDGSFIFNMRVNPAGKDLYILRADRLLTKVIVYYNADTPQIPMTIQDMRRLIKDYGISYVVYQSNFWHSLKNFQILKSVLQLPSYKLINKVPIEANVSHEDMELEIYQNLEWERIQDIPVKLDIPTIGMEIEGVINKSR